MQIGYFQPLNSSPLRDDRMRLQGMIESRGHKARVETRELGVRIGGFKVRYNSSRTTLDTDSLHREIEEYRKRTAARAFVQELEVAIQRLDCPGNGQDVVHRALAAPRGIDAYRVQQQSIELPVSRFLACV